MLEFEHHDHHACIADGVAVADTYCAENKLQFTPVRRRVLEILLERHTALGAYEILDVLREEALGSQPPVAYRALEFLVMHGFAHKIERLNAFVACSHMGKDHAPVFLICRSCDKVAEIHTDPENPSMLGKDRTSGFLVERVVTEATGLCPGCKDRSAA